MAEFQTRDSEGACIQHDSLREAISQAQNNPDVWKLSFNAEDGTRVRLVRMRGYSGAHGEPLWYYEPVLPPELEAELDKLFSGPSGVSTGQRLSAEQTEKQTH